MRRAALALLATLSLSLAACASSPGPAINPAASPGSTDIFHEALGAAPGTELIVTDLYLEANARGQAHYHPWEEYLYILEGSVELDVEGIGQRIISEREGFIIPARAIHTPQAGPTGTRAIVIRVHREGDPVRVLAEVD